MPRFLITTRRESRESTKPPSEAVKGFAGVSVVQVHSDDMVTVDATEADASELRDALGAQYHVEPEIRRGLH